MINTNSALDCDTILQNITQAKSQIETYILSITIQSAGTCTDTGCLHRILTRYEKVTDEILVCIMFIFFLRLIFARGEVEARPNATVARAAARSR